MVRKLPGKAALAALLTAGLLIVSSLPAHAGDPRRYADRQTWPDWAVEYTSETRNIPKDGELVDAIRFELIRGYPVQPQDYLQYEDREFRPYQEITRAEFAAVLSRSQALATEDGPEVWYAPYVAALQEVGIIPADASDDWSAPISRREAGQWMGRAAEYFEADERDDVPEFVDVDDPLILRALRSGIVKGTGQGQYEPDRALLRVEAAVMLLRLARARNRHIEPDTVEMLQGAIMEADRQASERGKRWVDQGYIDYVETGGVLTQEFADYLWFLARDNNAARPGKPWAWAIRPEELYRFEVLELHETAALLQSCGVEKVYRPDDPPDQPWYEYEFCERQFLVKRDDTWLLSGAAPPEGWGDPVDHEEG